MKANALLIEEFLAWKRHNRGRAAGTADKYRHALQRLVEYLGPERELLTASEPELAGFIGPWLHKQGVVALSRRVYVAAVRTFYRWAFDRRDIQSNPAASISYPKSRSRLPDVITLANAEKLMWAPDFQTFIGIRDGAMLALMIGCGIRISGLVALDEEDLQVRAIGGKERIFVKVREKGDMERLVPVPAEADLMLRAYLAHPALKKIERMSERGGRVLFVTTGNKRIPTQKYRGERRRFNRRMVNKMLLAYGREHDIPDAQLHPHAMRHLFGTELAEGDVQLLVQQQLLGHLDPKSTKVYTHLAVAKLTKEVDRAGPLAKIRTPTTDILQRLKT